MPLWSPGYKIRRSTRILSFAVNQLHSALNIMGEGVILLKRMARANAPAVQKDNRRVSTITKTISSFDTDPDTGNLRGLLWDASVDDPKEYPDQGVFTATVSASASTDVYALAVDKYSFISGRKEYAFDEYRDELDEDMNPIEDRVYIVFSTPPFHISDSAICTYGIANPLTKFTSMQPLRDNQDDFQRSLFGFDQWLSSTARVRGKVTPNQFLLAWPALDSDITITEGGLLQDSRISHWTSPPPYCPQLSEFDVIVRTSTGQRYQLVNFRRIYIEDIYVQQQFDLVELDPRSTIYNVPISLT